MAQLHWVHWAVVISSLLITFGAWHISKQQVTTRVEERFQTASSQVIELITDRMEKYANALQSGVAAIGTHEGDMSLGEWRRFADRMRIGRRYPGIMGIGVIFHLERFEVDEFLERQRAGRPDFRIHPAHGADELLPITYIEPVAENLRAVGLDMVHEVNRYTAATAARSSGQLRITGPIVLVQDEERTPGFLFFAPFYADGQAAGGTDGRNGFLGLVYAPFIVQRLLHGVLDQDKRPVRLAISDAGQMIYDEHTARDPGHDPEPMFTQRVSLDLYGRTWDFDIRTNHGFRTANNYAQPTVILVCGLVIDALLFTLFVLLSRANRRAIDFADRATRALRMETRELEASNAELERFAYVASHDLKTPLRGVAFLTECIEEDLEPYFSGTANNPDVARNLDRLRDQVQRMDGLIKGVLDYSQVNGEPIRLTEIDTTELFLRLAEIHDLEPGQLIFETEMPVLSTDALRFEQVTANLVGNAIKYHPTRDDLQIRVRAEQRDEFFAFTIADNGPGIDPKYHTRIFGMFETLDNSGNAESTGVGLSIAQKAVNAHGGTIRVDSEPGIGAAFTFEWPRDLTVAREHLESSLAAE